MGNGGAAWGAEAGHDRSEDRAATHAWVTKALAEGEHVTEAVRLRGGWTSEMRRLRVEGPAGERAMVLRSFVRPFFVRHAPGLLSREADVLRLLGGTEVPAPSLVAVDATAEHCDFPSLLMTLLPGGVRVQDEGAGRRAQLLAEQLLRIHRVRVTEESRPRTYQPWASAERVTPPADGGRPGLWERAVEVIRRAPPEYQGCFLHRDFHPGNVLFTGPDTSTGTDSGAGTGTGTGTGTGSSTGDDLRISGVVDWVETSWGPADLDVAHCSTTLALLHGAPTGMRFADLYLAAGGKLAEDPAAQLYWRLLDALAFAPEAEKVAVPWRELGRIDLTPEVLTGRLEDYLQALFDRFG
ncbi:phosphotransferase family protein [Streptomyces sp. NPDC059881]|uniref:phosphotransferase family protein n=1 Tax=Streptomyces sp. NPDC059881 TaxID=3346986 RepID=UPI003664130D